MRRSGHRDDSAHVQDDVLLLHQPDLAKHLLPQISMLSAFSAEQKRLGNGPEGFGSDVRVRAWPAGRIPELARKVSGESQDQAESQELDRSSGMAESTTRRLAPCRAATFAFAPALGSHPSPIRIAQREFAFSPFRFGFGGRSRNGNSRQRQVCSNLVPSFSFGVRLQLRE